MTRPLLDRRFAPATDVVGYVDAPIDACAEAARRLVAGQLGLDAASITRQPVAGPLDSALSTLVACRRPSYLVAPTTASWTAVFFGDPRGADPRQVVGTMPDQLSCRAVLVYAYGRADDGFVGFMLTEPGRSGMLDPARLLIVDPREGEQHVQAHGRPLAAEPTDPATFDLHALDEVMRSLGIAAFDAAFHLPPGTEAVLLEPH